MSARYLSGREHVLRVAAVLRVIELAIETLIAYRRTFHSYGQADKTFLDNCIHLMDQTRAGSTKRVTIGAAVVQSAIYLVNTSMKQFEIMFEPTLHAGASNPE